MASRTEGIALLSMYNDDEDDDEPLASSPPLRDYDAGDTVASKDATASAPPPSSETSSAKESSSPAGQFRPSPSSDEDPEYYKSPRSPTPPPLLSIPQSQPSRASLPVLDRQGARMEAKGSLTIVDYAHDEMVMSPENEDGEIASSGLVVIGMELQISEGTPEVTTPPGTVQVLSLSSQSVPTQSSDLPEHVKSGTTDYAGTEPEVTQEQIVTSVHEEMQVDPDPLKNFLPPPLTTKCPEELQDKINKFLAYKRAGKSFNADLRNRKDYRNPDFLQHAVRYQDIDQIGSCFSNDVFDPHGYDKSDYYDEIEADMKREIERKKSQMVDFVVGGTQPGTIPQIPVGTATAGLQSHSAAVDAVLRDIRQNKKSKWDKVDGDTSNPLHSGARDNLSVVGVHATHLSAVNAGSGYTAFAQQKRREAEEKKSSERKFDRRS